MIGNSPNALKEKNGSIDSIDLNDLVERMNQTNSPPTDRMDCSKKEFTNFQITNQDLDLKLKQQLNQKLTEKLTEKFDQKINQYSNHLTEPINKQFKSQLNQLTNHLSSDYEQKKNSINNLKDHEIRRIVNEEEPKLDFKNCIKSVI